MAEAAWSPSTAFAPRRQMKGSTPLGLFLLVLALQTMTTAIAEATDGSTNGSTSSPTLLAWVRSKTGGSLTFEWKVAPAWSQTNSVDDITSFRVYVNDQQAIKLGATESVYTAYGLTNDTQYLFQVGGDLVNGSNATSDLISDTIVDQTGPISAPRVTSVPILTNVTGGVVVVQVTPSGDSGGCNLTNLTVIARRSDGTIASTQMKSLNDTEFTFNRLDAQTAYWISAFATNGAGLSSSESTNLTVTTRSIDAPGLCPPPTVVNVTGGSVRLRMNPPLDDGGARITGYIVFMALNDSSSYEEVDTVPVGTSIDLVDVFNVPGGDAGPLVPLTGYKFKALAVTLVDTCTSLPTSVELASWASAQTTQVSLPDAPIAPYFVGSTGGQITAYLVQPRDMKGSTLTGFSVEVNGTVSDYVAASRSVLHQINFLTSDTVYSVRVAAVTDYGSTPMSEPSQMSTTTSTAPSAPRNLTVRNVSASSAIVNWSTPLDTGGLNIVGYTIVLETLEESYELSSPSPTITLRNLNASTNYTVQVIPINGAGKQGRWNASGEVPFETLSLIAPSAPVNITSLFRSGGAIEVTWSLPVETGGSDLDDLQYNVTMVDVASCYRSEDVDPCQGCNLVKVSDDYEVLENEENCTKSTGSCPDGSSDCCVTFESSLYGFGQLCSQGNFSERLHTVRQTNSSTFWNLTHSTTYYFGVLAANDAGPSQLSRIVALHTTGPTPSSYPLHLRVPSATGGSIQLEWNRPMDSGGTPIVGYRVYRDLVLQNYQSSLYQYIDCNLEADTTYMYSIAALNASHQEGDMISMNVSTTTVTPPLAPTIRLTGHTVSSLSISVTLACDTGGKRPSELEYSVVQNDTVLQTSTFDCCNFTVQNLSANEYYLVYVGVGNSAGTSERAWGNYSTSTGIPLTPLLSVKRVNAYSVELQLANLDQEIVSFDVMNRRHEDDSWTIKTTECGFEQCPSLYRLYPLLANTTYDIYLRVNGPNGASSSDVETFTTASIPNTTLGVFEFGSSDYNTSIGDRITISVLRVDQNGGDASVGLVAANSDSIDLGCSCSVEYGCECTMAPMTSTGSNQPAYMTFSDDQESQNVSIEVLNGGWNISRPVSVVLNLLSYDTNATIAEATLYIDLDQDSGLVSFAESSSVVWENASYAKIDLERFNGSAGEIVVQIATFDMTATGGTDYVSLTTTVRFMDRQVYSSLWIALVDDSIYRGTRYFGVGMSQVTLNGIFLWETREVAINDNEDHSRAAPHSPPEISSSRSTGGEIELQWTVEDDSTEFVAGYLVQVEQSDETSSRSQYNMTDSQFILSGLSPNIEFRVRVAAWNAYGVSPFSAGNLIATTEATLPGPPRMIQETFVSGTTVEIAWSSPRDDGGSSILGYTVAVFAGSNATKSLQVITVIDEMVVVAGLSPVTVYSISVATRTLAFPSETVAMSNATLYVTTTNGATPGQPTAVTQLKRFASGGVLSVKIDGPDDTGGWPITMYTLYLRERDTVGLDASGEQQSQTRSSFRSVCNSTSDASTGDFNSTTCDVYKLLAGTSYELYAVAANEMGSSVPSKVVVFRASDLITLPSRPLNFKTTNVTAGNVIFEWDLPLDLGGVNDMIGYIVYQAYNGSSDASLFTVYDGQDSPSRSVTLRGFQRASDYRFAVVALNSASFCVRPDDRDRTELLTVTTLNYSQLWEPGNLTVVSRTGGQLMIGWSEPFDLAGVPLQGYVVNQHVPDTDTSTLLTAAPLSNDTLSFTHFNLTATTQYCYSVTAVNVDGLGKPSPIHCFETDVVTRPTPVQSLSTTIIKAGAIGLEWRVPLDTGGRVIAYYQISRTRMGDTASTTTSLVETTFFYDDVGLSALSSYMYSIVPYNSVKSGETAYIAVVTAIPSPPQSPTIRHVIPYGGRIEVEWTAPADSGGIAIFEYRLTLSTLETSTADEYVTIENTTVPANQANYTFEKLTANTSYNITIMARNTVGESQLAKSNTTTESPDLPGTPLWPNASDISGSSIKLSVQDPEYTGGDNITMVLYRDMKMAYVFPSTERSVTIYGLQAETQYQFSSGARNTRGEAYSENISVTTGPISTPSQVDNVTLIDASFDQLLIAWNTVNDTGGDVSISYNVTYFRCTTDEAPEEAPHSVLVTATNATLVSLVNSSLYSVSVAAVTKTHLVGPSSVIILVSTEPPQTGVLVARDTEVYVREDQGFVLVPILRVNGSYGNTSFAFATMDDTASADTNYVSINGSQSVASGVDFAFVNVTIQNDQIYNPNISFVLLVQSEDATVTSKSRIIILDDGDAGSISFKFGSTSVLENSGQLVLELERAKFWSPQVIVQVSLTGQTGTFDRFQLPQTNMTFDIGTTVQSIVLVINDDEEYQPVPDSVNVSFSILSGGAMFGTFPTVNITAADNGDVSIPGVCTKLHDINSTGGSISLQWNPPLFRGAASVSLTYVISMWTDGQFMNSYVADYENTTISGLNASTAYDFTVQATNRAGTGQQSAVVLIATRSASVPTGPRNVKLLASTSSTLLLSWDPPLDSGGTTILNYKLFNMSDAEPLPFAHVTCSTLTQCTIQGLMAMTSYTVQIGAMTSYSPLGDLSPAVAFSTSEPERPDAPPSPNVSWVSAGAMTIQMQDPINFGGSAIQQYQLYMTEKGGMEFIQIYSGPDQAFTIYRLKLNTWYQVKYRVVNSVGASDDSLTTEAETLARSLPSAPMDVAVVNTTGGSLAVTWSEPLDVGGRDITGYVVMLTGMNSTIADSVGYDGTGDRKTQAVLYGLTANTTYSMYVIALTDASNCMDKALRARSSTVVSQTMPATAPGAPPRMDVLRVTGGVIELIWSAPQDLGGVALTGYSIFVVSPTGGESMIYTSSNTSLLSFAHTNLTEATTYLYTVVASNEAGASPPSPPFNFETLPATQPSAPLNVVQLPLRTGGSVQIGWSPPFDNGGQPILSFSIYRNGNLIANNVSSSTKCFTDKVNLTADALYEYTIQAVSRSGLISPLSAPCGARTSQATTPKPPKFTNNYIGSGYSNFTWEADTDAGGLLATYYELSLLSNGTYLQSYSGTSNSYSATGLSASSKYTVSLTTVNSVGPSTPEVLSITTNVSSVPGVPASPLSLSVFGGNFTVQVFLPLESGGLAASAIKIYEQKLGLIGTLDASQKSPYVFTHFGTTSETNYVISSAVVNKVGEGKPSTASVIRTAPLNRPGSIALAPRNTSIAGTTMSLVWTPPADTGGDSNLTYDVQVTAKSGDVVAVSTSSTEITITRLQFDTKYSAVVRALNPVGYGSWSPPLSLATQPDSAGDFTFVDASMSVLENATTASLSVVRVNGLSGRVNVSYTITSPAVGGATIGKDVAVHPGLNVSTGTLVFEDQQNQGNITVYILDDAIYEDPKVFNVNFAVNGSAKLGEKSQMTVTILDDGDAGYISFEKTAMRFSENAQTAVIPIVREKGNSSRIQLQFMYIDGTALVDQDYGKGSSTLWMEDGVTRAEIKVPIINDRVFEYPDETFSITIKISSGGAKLDRSSTTITIVDDGDVSVPAVCPPPVLISITGGMAIFQLWLPEHNGSTGGVLLNYVARVESGGSVSVSRKPVLPELRLGNLTALTSYQVSVAANNSVGVGAFSTSVSFTTNAASLPGLITRVRLLRATGGSISITWNPPADNGGVHLTKYRVYMLVGNSSQIAVENSQPVTSATINGLTANSVYSFLFQAGNDLPTPKLTPGWGNMSNTFNFSTLPPTLPGPVQIHPGHYRKPTGGAITLSWDAPQDTGGTNISGYSIYAKTAGHGFFLAESEFNLPDLYATAKVLNASSSYSFFVLARNQVGKVSLPGNISLVSGASMMQTTSDLSRVLQFGAVVSVQNTIAIVGNMSKAVSTMIPLLYPHVGGSVTGGQGAILGNVSNFTTLTTTAATLPRSPAAPVLVTATGGALAFALESPFDTGGIPITDFKVYWNGAQLAAESMQKTVYQLDSLRIIMEIAVGNLTPLTNYTISCVALNKLSQCYFGREATSPEMTNQTGNLSPPSQPYIKGASMTGGGMTLNLVDPFDLGGKAIELYTIFFRETSGSEQWLLGYNGSDHKPTIAPLRLLTAYQVTASASNGVFASQNSSIVPVKTTTVSAPGACSAPSLKNATGGMLNVTWKLPLDDGGATVNLFYITIASGSDGSGKRTFNSSKLWYTIYGLTAQSEYDVVVRARNVKGAGPESPPAHFNTTSGTPPIGDMVVEVVDTTGGAARITFNEPDDLGGARSEDMVYQVFVDNDNRVNLTYTAELLGGIVSAGHRRLEHVSRRLSNVIGGVVPGLDPESLYDIQIRPVNVFASGGMSSGSPAMTAPATAPSAPQNIRVVSSSGGSVLVEWDPPADFGGLPLLAYTLRMSSHSGGPFADAAIDISSSATIYNLLPLTEYWFYAVAANGAGESSDSSTIRFTTPAKTVPSKPLDLSIVSVAVDSVECEWIPPLDTGGDTIALYIVTAASLSGSSPSTSANTTLNRVTLPLGNTPTGYAITVIASNTNTTTGYWGPPSAARYITTPSSQLMVSTPQISCVSQRSIALFWHAYPNAVSYRVRRDGTEIYPNQSTSFIDVADFLTKPSTVYDVMGEYPGPIDGPWSAPVTVLSQDLPTDENETICGGEFGHVSLRDYSNNMSSTWKISPRSMFSSIVLNFTLFELECDHDSLTIQDLNSGEVLWKGGCFRDGPFLVQVNSSVVLRFVSDDSVTRRGFEMKYEVDAYLPAKRIPAPGGSAYACSSHGQSDSNGVCTCSIGFTGEDCSNRVTCCSNRNRCHHSICDVDPSQVVVVSAETGDDEQGTGRMMDASEKGTASKAVRSIARALNISTSGGYIFLHPGVYTGELNRNLTVGDTNVTIQTLKGSAWTRVNCDNKTRVLSINNSEAIISGLSLENCSAVDGGAISAADSTVYVEDVMIRSGAAERYGGAIFASSCQLNLAQMQITSCRSLTSGGAIFARNSTVTVNQSTVSNGYSDRGGALALFDDSILVSNGASSVLSNNTASQGGAMYVEGTVTIDGISLLQNTAVSGGAISVGEGSHLSLRHLVVSNNSAIQAGGGIAIANEVAVEFENVSIVANRARSSGGGIFVTGNSSIQSSNISSSRSIVQANTADIGAGIYAENSSLHLSDLIVENGNATTRGGGLALLGSLVTCWNLTIRSNNASMGGAIAATDSRTEPLGAVIVSNNSAIDGGGFWMDNASVLGEHGILCEFNSARNCGGCIHATNSAELENLQMHGNTADALGGGVCTASDTRMRLHNSSIVNCSSRTRGGGMWLKRSVVDATDSFVGGTMSRYGGGVYADSSNITGILEIDGSAATERGGGLYYVGDGEVSAVQVMNCKAAQGGAVFVGDATLVVADTVLKSSTATDGGGMFAKLASILVDGVQIISHEGDLGGGVFLSDSLLFHSNTSISNCVAHHGGGGYLANSSIVARDSMIDLESPFLKLFDNMATHSGGQLYLTNNSDISHLDLLNGSAGYDGGGIMVNGSTTEIRNITSRNNTALDGGGIGLVDSVCSLSNVSISDNAVASGGGISIKNSDLLHEELEVVASSAQNGAGIYAVGTVSISSLGNIAFSRAKLAFNSVTDPSIGLGGTLYIEKNSKVSASGLDIQNGSAYHGGGIYVSGSRLVLADTQISQCRASSGAGMYVSDETQVELAGVDFDANNATQVGGAIASSASDILPLNEIALTNCLFNANVASIGGGAVMMVRTHLNGTANTFLANMVTNGDGGAIWAQGKSILSISEWNFFNNTMHESDSNHGGTLSLKDGTTTTISNSLLLSNKDATLVKYGGVIYIQDSSTSLNISNSRLGMGQSFSGGAIWSMDASVTLVNCTVDNGYAYDFGAGIFAQNTRLSILNSVVSKNFAYYDGGGLYMQDGGTLTIDQSIIEHNAVEAGGGAIYLAPAAEINASITNSDIVYNANYGFGSAMFVGRKNTLKLGHCLFARNGDKSTEGGTVYLVDAAATIEDTIFESNQAKNGAGVELTRDASLTIRRSTLRQNRVIGNGGALHASVRANAEVIDSNIEGNIALEGGAVHAIGLAQFHFINTTAANNRAQTYGGAFSIRGSAQLQINDSELFNNSAYTGGGIAVLEESWLNISTTRFDSNQAEDFGGGIFVNQDTNEEQQSTKVLMTFPSLQFDENSASAGADIFWVYHAWFELACYDCTSVSLSQPSVDIATSPTYVTPGWWPSAVMSGVKLGVEKESDSLATEARRLQAASMDDQSTLQSAAQNINLSDPMSDVLWPTIVVRDYYGAIARTDNKTLCTALISSDESEPFAFAPASGILVKNGYITFKNTAVFSTSRSLPYTLNVECLLSSDVNHSLSIDITVESCLPGYENVDGNCLACEKGKYSLDGRKCYLCPPGATCEETDSVGVALGVSAPIRLDGYFVSDSRATFLEASCKDPSSWKDGDPCRDVESDSIGERIFKCSKLDGFSRYWNRDRIFSCISGMEYYGCDTYDACIQDNTSSSVTTVTTLSSSSQCDAGYKGVMCAVCEDSYYRVSNGSCKPCTDPDDPSVARTTELLTMIPIVYGVIACAMICYYLSNPTESEIMKYARAAKSFKIYNTNSSALSMLRAARFYVKERGQQMIRSLRARLPRRRSWPFQIAPKPVSVPPFRAEKFKILLGFFQIFGGFKHTYEIPWPDEMSRLMDVYSLADFNFIDTTSIECFYKRDYFASYRLIALALVMLLFAITLLLVWGSVRYRVILSTLPRHCVRCGLPVFQMLRRAPHTLAKRKTMVSMLKMESKKQLDSTGRKRLGARMHSNLSSRIERVFQRAKVWCAQTRLGQIVDRWMVKTRLPASSSEHRPSCPTSHRIENDVLSMVVRSNVRLWRARIRLRLNYQSYQNRCIKLIFWVLLLFYPELSARVIGIFYCQEIGSRFYMTRDRRYECYDGDWLVYLPVSIALIFVWVIGVPLLFWTILFIKRRHGVADTLLLLEDPVNVQRKERLLIELRRDLIDRGKKIDEDQLQFFESEMMAEFLRDKKLKEPKMIAQVGFIYHSYDARFWWFEVWDLGRKLFLNCIVSLLADAGANRIIVGLIVLLVYLAVMLFFQPYKDRSDSALSGATQIQLFITLFCGLILNMGSHYLEDSVVYLLTYAAFVTNVITLLFALISIVRERHVAAKRLQRQGHEEHRRAIRAHVRKLWRRAYGFAFTEVYMRDLSIRPMPVQVILELARRDRIARQVAALTEQLEMTAPVSIGEPREESAAN